MWPLNTSSRAEQRGEQQAREQQAREQQAVAQLNARLQASVEQSYETAARAVREQRAQRGY